MKHALHCLLALALSLAVLASDVPIMSRKEEEVQSHNVSLFANSTNIADPTHTAGYDPSFEYHSFSLVQIWIGKDKVTVGTVIGPQLYSTVWHLLDDNCPHDEAATCYSGRTDLCFQTTAQVDDKPKESKTCIGGIRAEWSNSRLRNLLIGAVAGSLEALTKPLAGLNNYFMIENKKACNVGDVVRVNFRGLKDAKGIERRNYMHIKLWNHATMAGYWSCCKDNERENVDYAIDGLGDEISDLYHGEKFTRDSRCILYEWVTCEDA